MSREDALDVAMVGATPLGEAHAPMSAMEERAHLRLKHADAVSDRGGSNANLLGRLRKALVPCGQRRNRANSREVEAGTCRCGSLRKRRLAI